MMTRTLQEQIEGPEPESWEPEAGDTILGEIEAISDREGGWGPYQVVTVLKDDGTAWNVACWDSVCKNKLAEFNPAPKAGDLIAFKFLGEKGNKAGTATYKNWSVRLAPVAAATDTVLAAVASSGDSFPEGEDI